MLWILDTNHYREIERGTSQGGVVRERLIESAGLAAITIITAEEVVRGRLARIAPQRQTDRGVASYAQFQDSLESFASIMILPWSNRSADVFDVLHVHRIRAGTLDLRIASIALEYNATLLTRNLVDFQKVPGLRVENWLD